MMSGIGLGPGPDALGLVPEQVRRFTLEDIRVRSGRAFDARNALREFRERDGETVLAVDIGGDKLMAAHFTVRDGSLRLAGRMPTLHGDEGRGYLGMLRDLAAAARAEGIRTGISVAGPVSGTRLEAGPNLAVLAGELQAGYGGDFAGLFPSVAVANDAEAGLLAAAIEAARRYPGSRDVIYVINGSGLGGAVLAGNHVYAAEPGHVAVVDELNSVGGIRQVKPCGLDGATHTCVEAVAASKAGVEDMWRMAMGERLSGRQIAAMLAAGNALARGLYRNSARITAHVVLGLAAAFGLLDGQEGSEPAVIVGHGGIFQVPGYGEWLAASLDRALGQTPRILFTKDFSDNTCLEGAAILAAFPGG
jgi:predicted NBD/HSP70 family sugar kinase